MTIWHALASFFVQKNSPSSLSNVKSCLCSFVTKKEPSELRYPPPQKKHRKEKRNPKLSPMAVSLSTILSVDIYIYAISRILSQIKFSIVFV